jgi:hypothetical protein
MQISSMEIASRTVNIFKDLTVPYPNFQNHFLVYAESFFDGLLIPYMSGYSQETGSYSQCLPDSIV